MKMEVRHILPSIFDTRTLRNSAGSPVSSALCVCVCEQTLPSEAVLDASCGAILPSPGNVQSLSEIC